MRKRNEYQDRVAVDSVMDLVVGWQQLEELKHTGGTSAGASLVPSGGPSVVRSGGSASGSRAPSSWRRRLATDAELERMWSVLS